MADVAASIVGLVSFGLAVGKTLNDAAQDMIHAQKQIKSLRTHVQDFNSVLRQLGKVLEEDSSICSPEALRDIKRIIRSCKRTFKEIYQAIDSQRKSRLAVSVRWLFQKQHAKEIEARLDAQRSTLQSMVETITLSKMAEVATRSRAGERQLSKLAEELDFIKSVVLEQFESVKQLQIAEQRAAANLHDTLDLDDTPSASVAQPARQKPSRSAPWQGSSESQIEQSDSSDDESGSETDEGSKGSTSPPSSLYRNRQSTDSTADSSTSLTRSSRGILAIRHHALEPVSYSLQQMIPFVSDAVRQTESASAPSTALVKFQQKDTVDVSPAPILSVCLLLDKWTLSGSEPVVSLLSNDLEQGASEMQPTEGSRECRAFSGNESPEPRFMPKLSLPELSNKKQSSTGSDTEDDSDKDSQIMEDDSDMAQQSNFTEHRDSDEKSAAKFDMTKPPLRIQHIWAEEGHGGRMPTEDIGGDLISYLQEVGCKIPYWKDTVGRRSYYVGDAEVYRFYYIPPSLIPTNKLKRLSTYLSFPWVRQQALQNLGYDFKIEHGYVKIYRDLTFTQIQEIINETGKVTGKYFTAFTDIWIQRNGLQKAFDELKSTLPSEPNGRSSSEEDHRPLSPEALQSVHDLINDRVLKTSPRVFDDSPAGPGANSKRKDKKRSMTFGRMDNLAYGHQASDNNTSRSLGRPLMRPEASRKDSNRTPSQPLPNLPRQKTSYHNANDESNTKHTSKGTPQNKSKSTIKPEKSGRGSTPISSLPQDRETAQAVSARKFDERVVRQLRAIYRTHLQEP